MRTKKDQCSEGYESAIQLRTPNTENIINPEAKNQRQQGMIKPAKGHFLPYSELCKLN